MIQRFQVVLASPAVRDLNDIPARVLPAILAFIYGPMSENPHRVDAALDAPLAGHRAARRGSYRIVYQIDEAALVVTVIRVAARADVYRQR